MIDTEIKTKICTNKNCKYGGVPLPATIEYFYKSKNGKYGLRSVCAVCSRFYKKQYDINNVEKRKQYRLKNKDKLNNRSKQHYIDNIDTYKEVGKQNRLRVKILVIGHYGGKCACCGEIKLEFLSIDHINGGGKEHRKKLLADGISLYYWLINNNFPPGFRVLCFNCNHAYGHYNDCPHNKINNPIEYYI